MIIFYLEQVASANRGDINFPYKTHLKVSHLQENTKERKAQGEVQKG